MTVPQISVRLASAAKGEFEAYAAKMGLKASELAKLLIVRERYRQRLLKSGLQTKGRGNARRATGPVREMPKVTAHLSSVAEVDEFDAYAQRCGLDRNGAGVWLIETELKERWLERAILR